MRYIILTALLISISTFSYGQSKTVKIYIDSTKIYFNYFYKSKNISDYTLNDSVRFISRKITEDRFYFDKFINKQKKWTRIYRIELANDSLRITTRAADKKGNHKFVYSKEPYYNSFQIDN